MAKLPLKLKARIPNFMKDGPAWRRAIHAAVVEVQDRSKVRYGASDKLEVQVRLHLENPKLTILDLDNRLKDILDALQGFVGDKGHSGELRPIIPNDSQIYRLIIEKRRPPKKDLGAPSFIEIRRYSHDERTAREPRAREKSRQT